MIAALPWVTPSPSPERALLPARVERLRSTAAWTLAAWAILGARYFDWIARPRLWAEDGNVFFLDARQLGLASVFRPYAGYVHLLPRLIALVGSQLDPGVLPSFYVAASLGATLGVVVWLLGCDLDLPLRPLLAIAVVGVPSTGEVFLCPTNLQWIAAVILIVLPLTRAPGDPGAWVREAALVLALGLTGPFCVILFPLYLIHATWTRTRASWVRLLILLGPAIFQGVCMVLHPLAAVPGAPAGALNPSNLLAMVGSRVALAFLPAHGAAAGVPHAWALGAGALWVMGIILAAVWPGRWQLSRLYLACASLALLAAAALRCRYDLWTYPQTEIADRYFYLPRVLGVWLACLAGAMCLRRSRAFARLTLGAMLLGGLALGYFEGRAGDERPYFDWSRYGEALREGRSVSVTVSPGWTFQVPAQGGADSAQTSEPLPAPLPGHILWSTDAYFFVRVPNGWDPAAVRIEGLPRGLSLDRTSGAIRGVERRAGVFRAVLQLAGKQGWVSRPLELEFRRGKLLTDVSVPDRARALASVEVPYVAFSGDGKLEFIDVTDLTTGKLITRIEASQGQRRHWEGTVRLSLADPGSHTLGFRFVCFDRAHGGAYFFEDQTRQVLVCRN